MVHSSRLIISHPSWDSSKLLQPAQKKGYCYKPEQFRKALVSTLCVANAYRTYINATALVVGRWLCCRRLVFVSKNILTNSDISCLARASVPEIRAMMIKIPYDIIHFIGHGGPGGLLVLEDEGDYTPQS